MCIEKTQNQEETNCNHRKDEMRIIHDGNGSFGRNVKNVCNMVTRKPSPHTETHTRPWVGRCRRDVDLRICRRSVKL